MSAVGILLSWELELVLLSRGPFRMPRFGGLGGMGGSTCGCRGLVLALLGLFKEFKDVSELSDCKTPSFLFHACVVGYPGERWLFSSLRLELDPEVGISG